MALENEKGRAVLKQHSLSGKHLRKSSSHKDTALVVLVAGEEVHEEFEAEASEDFNMRSEIGRAHV